MIGVKLDNGRYSGAITAMMKKVGLKLKTIFLSISQDQEALSKVSDKVLGCLYDPKKDLIGVKFSFNPSKKKKGAKVKPDLTLPDVDTFYKSSQTERSLLSICNWIYDPLGLASPYTIKLKLLMKDTLSVDNLCQTISSRSGLWLSKMESLKIFSGFLVLPCVLRLSRNQDWLDSGMDHHNHSL